MKPSTALEVNRVEIREIVLAHNATNAHIFGSVVRGEEMVFVRGENHLS